MMGPPCRSPIDPSPKHIQDRIDELLYPDTLEDVDKLNEIAKRGLERVLRGEAWAEFPEGVKAAKALHEIRERGLRKKGEEREADAMERSLEREKSERQRILIEESILTSARNIAVVHGLPKNFFDRTPPEAVLKHARMLNQLLAHEREQYVALLRASTNGHGIGQ
jgi:hypothetical protein